MYTIDKVLRRVPQHGDAVPTQRGSPCANHALNASMSSVRDFVLESGAARARPVDASPLDVCRSASSHFMSLCSSALRVRRAVTTKLRGRRGSTKVCVARAFDPQSANYNLTYRTPSLKSCAASILSSTSRVVGKACAENKTPSESFTKTE